MKYIFFVQGEGRGHLMQAITLKEKLEKRGHLISAVFVGMNPNKALPDFFAKRMNLTPKIINGPVLITDKKNKGINPRLSIISTIKGVRLWPRYIKEIKKTIKEENPDVLVSFYEPLSRIYQIYSREKRPFFIIGHQFFVEHSTFKFPPKNFIRKLGFLLYNNFLAGKKTTKIALSFIKEEDEKLKRLIVCPPLIRKEILEASIENQNFIMVYLLNSGYGKSVESWAELHPENNFETFCDKEENNLKNLHYNLLNDCSFAETIRKCSTYVSTAGFDSIAEAAYLDKNIIMIPTGHHFEQLCNAYDADRLGIAVYGKNFNPEIITEDKKTQLKKNRMIFKNWVDCEGDKIIEVLENI